MGYNPRSGEQRQTRQLKACIREESKHKTHRLKTKQAHLKLNKKQKY